jgi:HD-like signal output (HDOD) protein
MPTTALQFAERAEQLYVLPDVYLRLKEVMADDSATMVDIANILALEPVLSANLLRIANSALFNFPRAIDSLSKAISILGTDEVHNLINAYGVTAAFSAVDSKILNMDRFWEISVDCALLCKYLAQKKGIKNAKTLFLSGLLHNIGELVVLQLAPNIVQYCQGYNKEETPWQRQQSILGFTYADCSVELLTLWQLPLNIILPIKTFHQAYAEQKDPHASLLYICSRLALLNSHPGMYAKKSFVGQHIMQDLGISMMELDQALDFCNSEGMSIMSALILKK